MTTTAEKLSRTCTLIAISISLPGKSRQDKRASARVTTEYQTSPDAARVIKRLYPLEALEKCEQIANKARALVYEHTVPWTDAGARILPAALMLTLAPQLNALLAEFDAAADDSAANFQQWIDAAQVFANGLFDRRNYPSTAEAYRRQFRARVDYLPMPSASHVVLDIAQAEIDQIRATTARAVEEAAAAARADILDRLRAPVAHAVETLGTAGKIFRNSLVENLKTAGEQAAGPLNITDDATITALGEEARTLTQYSPDMLRQHHSARVTVHQRAARLLAKIDAARATANAATE